MKKFLSKLELHKENNIGYILVIGGWTINPLDNTLTANDYREIIQPWFQDRKWLKAIIISPRVPFYIHTSLHTVKAFIAHNKDDYGLILFENPHTKPFFTEIEKLGFLIK